MEIIPDIYQCDDCDYWHISDEAYDKIGEPVISLLSNGYSISHRCEHCDWESTIDKLPKESVKMAIDLLKFKLNFNHTCGE